MKYIPGFVMLRHWKVTGGEGEGRICRHHGDLKSVLFRNKKGMIITCLNKLISTILVQENLLGCIKNIIINNV
jgi:hypothetical protein